MLTTTGVGADGQIARFFDLPNSIFSPLSGSVVLVERNGAYLQVRDRISLLELDLKHFQSADEGSQASQTLFPAATDTNEQSVAARRLEYAVDATPGKVAKKNTQTKKQVGKQANKASRTAGSMQEQQLPIAVTRGETNRRTYYFLPTTR